MISKKRFLAKRIIDDTIGKFLFKILSLRKKKPFPKKPGKIFVFKLSSIGDSLLSLPGIKNLKDSTGAKIVLVHSGDNEPVFKGHSFIDDRIVLNVSGNNPFRLLKALKSLRKEKADISFDLSHTGNLSAVFSLLSGRFTSGFYNPEYPKRRGFYDREIPLGKEKHMALNYNLLLDVTNKQAGVGSLVRPFFGKAKRKKINFLLKNKKNLVGIHPCHEIKEKSWSKENFAKLIDYLIEKGKIPVLLGSKKEEPEVKKLLFLVKNKKKVVDLSGKLDIEEVFCAMNYFDFFVSNDGGIMHIAASFNLPTLGIFSAETPKRYAPLNQKSFALDSRGISKEDSLKIAKNVIDSFINKHL